MQQMLPSPKIKVTRSRPFQSTGLDHLVLCSYKIEIVVKRRKYGYVYLLMLW